jgi:hypothetical protein
VIPSTKADGIANLKKEFRSSGVQEFRSSGVQEFSSSGVQEFRSSGVQEFRSSGVQEFRPVWSTKFARRKLLLLLNMRVAQRCRSGAPELPNSCNS